MKYRTLGKTGLKVSVVGVGTWQFGGEWGRTYEQHEVDAILGKAKEVGINLIDTAECYGDHLSESLIGGYIHNNREDWILATKFGHRFHRNFERTDLYDPKEVIAQLERSLRSLRTDYIDLYQFHSGPDASFDQDELWDTLNEQVKAGKIRHLGISIGSNENIHQTSRATAVNAEAIQVVYNRLDRNPEKEVFPSCVDQNLGVLARVPLASGLLSGKYKPGAKFEANDVRSRRDSEQLDALIREAEGIRSDEVPEGTDMAAWALAWCLKHPAVTSVIPGCKDPAQVEANALAVELVEDGHPQDA
ncbi:aldo/keto reductase [Cohnella lupini]|uniref:Aryl-alcohol dehydrogenase-like predicted oxidoreductase n=1 Tax=Cohnella lupini TaxID=1294267 RepID=A0A3D9IEY1_9BACL|nr:aldo/keto reductase [Cohnella lupini]RED60245.1 aryl-alcohol dehydrogenase-like predicted oxidoreductase [Cohnella lupini]